MRTLHAEHYETLAKKAVDQFLSAQTPLSELIAKSASHLELTPEQVRTLVQSANQMAHLALMDRRVDGDKYVDFSPVDPDVIIKKIFIETTETPRDRTAEDRISDFLGNLPETDKPIPLNEEIPDATKEAAFASETSFEWEPKPTDAEADSRRAQRSIRTLRKVADELRDRQHKALAEYRDALDKLAHIFRRIDAPSFATFEKNAVALYGDFGAGVAKQLRALTNQKTAGEIIVPTRYVVDNSTREMELLDALAKAAEYFADCKHGIERLEVSLKPHRKVR